MRKVLLSLGSILLAAGAALAGEARPHHELTAVLDPAGHRIEVTDVVTLPAGKAKTPLRFLLHAGLEVSCETPGVTVAPDPTELKAADFGMAEEDFRARASVPRKKYVLTFAEEPEGPASFTLRYRGEIHHPIRELAQEYARGFSLTPGLITERGVYLGAATWWTPWFGDALFTFVLTANLPEAWDVVSQGTRTLHEMKEGRRWTRWESKEPMEEVYFIAATFTEYSLSAGAVEVMAFLRTPDENLANKYLETTAQYLEMYRKLIGLYPFSKFALVENFWQTGYGMPSFTLLGDRVIRLPFILHSSYPHELLHNYWGNSVYVDYKTGNWCEGTTVYMADHLIKEQRGAGLEYRRTALQKYTDYVTPETDFPLTAFLGRYNAATEAVGYGKAMMLWNMLRRRLGDETFVKGFRKFYSDNKFRAASYADIRKAFEAVTGKDLGAFFDQWVARKGAPSLRLSDCKVAKGEKGFRLTFRLRQVQEGEAYSLEVPVAVTTKEGIQLSTVSMTGKNQIFKRLLEKEPLLLQVDPRFDLFRVLDPDEVPPSLSKIFGAEKILILLPSKAEEESLKAYRALAGVWSKDRTKKITVALDRDVPELPEDAMVWIFGDENLHEGLVRKGLEGYDAELDDDAFRLGRSSFDRKKHCCVVAVRHPGNRSAVAALLTVARKDAVNGLSRKLLHYGRYSALVFEGAEPTNVGKESWLAVRSPLAAVPAGVSGTPAPETELPKHRPLATLAPVFSADRMMGHVKTLSHDDLEGRGLGTPGIEKAAEYIAGAFEEAGLRPGGGGESWFQAWEDVVGPGDRKGTVKNVIGVLPGTKAEYAGQSVILCAHYDHLGHGWPDVRKGNEGKIHNGADDNASGVAVMLEMARLLGKRFKPDRTVLFIAFTAEENGLVGSRHYVKHAKAFPASKIMGVLNLDTVGRLGSKKLLVLNSASAREWKFIFMGAEYVTGVGAEMPTQDITPGDQLSFIEAGVPGVQFFSGAHEDYHRPTDTADRIDPAGMVKVASFVREAVLYLAARENPLTFKGGKPAGKKPPAPKGTRRASTGSMPDFSYSGKGVRIGAVSKGSPAEKAGLKKGDVIVKIGDKEVGNLRDYSEALKAYKPGDEAELVYLRDGKEHTVKIVLGER